MPDLVDLARPKYRPSCARGLASVVADVLRFVCPQDLVFDLNAYSSFRRHDFGHIGLVVEDLDETVRFLGLLGLNCDKPGVFSGEWADQIMGLENVTVEIAMARAPDGSDVFEQLRFHSPSSRAEEPMPAANRPGLRHIALKVDDVRGVVDRVREAGWDTVGEIVRKERCTAAAGTATRRRSAQV